MNGSTTTVEQLTPATLARVKEAGAQGIRVQEITTDGIYTLEQIQSAARVSRPTLYRWRNGGGLRVIRVGNVVRVRGKDFLEFLERYATTEKGDANKGGE